MVHFKLLVTIAFILLALGLKAQQPPLPQQESYPLVVSFYSTGSGTNKIARSAFKNYVESFEKKYDLKLNWGETPWGREGETDYCFELEKLSNHKKSKFIAGIKKVLENAPQVRVTEHTPCHKH